jgi:hypothetical protein
MPIAYGITEVGFVGKPASVIKAETEEFLKSGPLGASAGTEPDGSIPAASVAGQLVALVVDVASSLWELQQAADAARDPGQAGGAAQNVLCSLTGILRHPSAFSGTTATCTGTPATVLPIGRVATVEGTGTRFRSLAAATIVAVDAWVLLTAYIVGDRITVGGKVYVCKTAGTTAATAAAFTAPLDVTDITDGSAHWTLIGTGTGAVDVEFAAEESGPVTALARTLSSIATPVGGWSSVINLADASVGADQETDSALRLRREEELFAPGTGTADAIRAAILAVNQGSTDPLHKPVISCRVLHNDTDVVDGNGLEPHSVEVLAHYANNENSSASATTEQDIADAIFANVAAGIRTVAHSTSPVVATVVDSEGNAQQVRWSKPSQRQVYIVCTVYYDASKWPAGTTAATVKLYVASALLTYGASLPIGQSLRSTELINAIFSGPAAISGTEALIALATSPPVPGVLDVAPCYLGTAPAPATTVTIVADLREHLLVESARITVTDAIATTP